MQTFCQGLSASQGTKHWSHQPLPSTAHVSRKLGSGAGTRTSTLCDAGSAINCCAWCKSQEWSLTSTRKKTKQNKQLTSKWHFRSDGVHVSNKKRLFSFANRRAKKWNPQRSYHYTNTKMAKIQPIITSASKNDKKWESQKLLMKSSNWYS